MPLTSFHPVVRAWFEETFGSPTPPQAEGWPVIARGENALILAPTGSGKTLAAFLKCLDALYQQGDRLLPGVQVLYISPLKALNNDIHRNLEVPLRGIEAKAAELGIPLPTLTTAVRTGDTPQRERTAMVRRPPHVLITTPESLYLMLTSRARDILRTVRYVIVDEIHAVCASKRGVHLSLSLERLEALTRTSPVRIGLSATQRPLEEIARYLGGAGRDVRIIDTGTRKNLDLLIEVPLEDMRALPDNSMWNAIYPRLLELIEQHRSTLIFVNYRGLAEKLADRLNSLAGREIARVHHGAISRETRETVERELKEGRLPCLVATSSLELGIDVGAIDLVVQVESPQSTARGLQRVGRAGHIVGQASKGRMLPKYRGDLLEMACIAREMLRGRVEETHIPTGALDVLAQQIIAMAAMDDWPVADLLTVVRRSHCYRDLSRRQLELVLGMLAGDYPSDRFRDLKPRLVWDRETDTIRGRDGSRAIAVLSGGTIPDRGYYGIYVKGTDVKLGEMDEEFVYESRQGEVFLLGTSTWRVETIEQNRMIVSPAISATPRMPFWKGDGPGRPYELGLLMGSFTREAAERLDEDNLKPWLARECALDSRAAANLASYLREQRDAAGVLPTDRTLIVERFPDELGDQRIAVLSPFGSRVNLAWMVVLERRVHELLGIEPELTQSDDGILIRVPASDAPLPLAELLRIDPARAEEILLEEIGNTPVFGAFFRMNAGRSLVLPRPRPGKRQPFWLQRLRAADLLQVARQFESFPVVVETYREVLHDVLDLQGLKQVLSAIWLGDLTVEAVESVTPSPFAASLLMGFIGAYMYKGEAPKAERRGALLGVSRDLLREVIGSEQLRNLLDKRAIVEIDSRLQRLAADWRPRGRDETEDLLRQLGDFSAAELALRGVKPEWLTQLADEKRAVRIVLAGEERWIAAVDQALYADLETNRLQIIRRFAVNRGPFRPEQAAERYGFLTDDVFHCLETLQAQQVVAGGEFTPGETGREFCGVEALQQIHRLTLSLLRREIEPVSADAFARYLIAWQSIGTRQPRSAGRSGPPPALREAIAQLQGLALPVECWERDILPARVPGYQPLWLDQLCATGEVRWCMRRGKIAFALAENADLLSLRLPAEEDGGAGTAAPALSECADAVLTALAVARADFLGGVARAAGLPPAATLDALLELMALGLVTNDTFAPARLLGLRGRGAATRRTSMLQGGTGRWSLTAPADAPPANPAERYADILLQRYGVVTYEVWSAEDCPVSWSGIIDVLKRMESRGQLRRGWFVRELTGAQFALPAAVERLRAARDRHDGAPRLVAACDPANACGAILPAGNGERLSRVPSNYLVLVDGRPALAVEASGRRLSPLTDLAGDDLRGALACLKGLLGPAGSAGLRRVEVEEYAGEAVGRSPAGPLLEELGFQRGPLKLVLYR